MQRNRDILAGYENMPLIHYASEEARNLPNIIAYDELANHDVVGVLKGNRYVDGKLMQLYSTNENHVCVIAATRLGKTSSYMINMIYSNAQRKRSMVVIDIKAEAYRICAPTLIAMGYNVRLINLRDHMHSECWNMLTKIFRKYIKALTIADSVCVIEIDNKLCYKFMDETYTDQRELDKAVKRVMRMMIEDVYNDIDQIAAVLMPTLNKEDPYWENSSREIFKAILYALLEDATNEDNPITEETFSLNTVIEVSSNFSASDNKRFDDGGFFSSRNSASQAYKIAKSVVMNNAGTTAACILSTFYSKLAVFKDVSPRVITSANSFEMSELVERPTVVFINFRDEIKLHYQIVSLFIQDIYRFLVGYADDQTTGKLDAPFYFIADEFGNLPKIDGFETMISASAGRNIFFIIALQSYAQLDNVYGRDVAAIIRDNLNMHVFFGSNNPATLEEFSKECGKMTRISPLSALNGEKENIDKYQFETIPNVPVSMLSHFEPGECIITEANSGYVLYSRLERYYLCNEFKDLPQADCKQYKREINPFDDKYIYKPSKVKSSRTQKNLFDDFNFDF